MVSWLCFLLVISCCELSIQMVINNKEYDNLQLKFVSVNSDNLCCNSEHVLLKTCTQKCNLIWRACLLPKCSFSTFLNCTKTRDVKDITLEWRGETTLLIQLWKFDSIAYKHDLSNKAFQMVTEFMGKVIPTPNWIASRLENEANYFYLHSRLSCSTCHQMSHKLGEISKRIWFPFSNFHKTFTNFVNKMYGFSSRLSNIVNLLDVMKRIISNIF